MSSNMFLPLKNVLQFLIQTKTLQIYIERNQTHREKVFSHQMSLSKHPQKLVRDRADIIRSVRLYLIFLRCVVPRILQKDIPGTWSLGKQNFPGLLCP